ncbi:abc transporter [Plasmopara halstedii]|uniref:Abc transporter n=1 Tax=Plasmopara halstedii TaxID=4781 RepID=A0A0P1B127_PLAHL|nr:abc transporter [Plasmopara halstedii]CEG47386.1 abc transporter [Plasmopara halstedii]|eukprot:XP_024583755.1 abc transporter [Plasmopara halstedii]
MVPTMHRLDGNRIAANTPLDLSNLRSHKEKRTLKRDKARLKRSQASSQLHNNESEISNNPKRTPIIFATSQQSRFHTVTFDEFGKNVLLNQFTLAIGTSSSDASINEAGVVELLRDTQLKLNYGTRYGLVGPNGIGKSTLLTALADGIVEGLPSALKVLYVNQLDISSLTSESAMQSVVQTVLSADTRVKKLHMKITLLQNALSDSTILDSGVKKFSTFKAQLLHALLSVQVMEAEEAEKLARKIAIKRSGKLGKIARLQLVEAEHKTASLQQRLKYTLLDDGNHESVITAHETDILHEIHLKINDYQQELEILDETSMEARARRILSSMSIDSAKQDAPLSSLSGGWQVRILLARVLFMEPDFLLLDEPTNHLDMPSILWLTNYLLTLGDVLRTTITLVVVSHDRMFLNTVTEETIFFRGYDKTLAYFEGNYDTFERSIASKRQFNARLQAKLDKKTELMSDMVSKLSQQATRARDDKKLHVAASKKTKMNRIGLERSAKGTRFKLNRDRAGYHLTDRDQAEDQAKYDETDGSYSGCSAWRMLSFSPPQIRNLTKLDNTTMISFKNISFRYQTQELEKTRVPFVSNLNININFGDKVVLVGRNGSGKTTIMKLLSRTLKPESGQVEYFHGARIASLMQHDVEHLKRQEWSRDLTPLKLLRTKLKLDQAGLLAEFEGGNISVSDGNIRGHLSTFGISGETVAAVPIHSLSGGQLVRVCLAYATFPFPPHVLLLDEPTNHLDMNTIQYLGEALRKYKGAVVLISHDLHFLNIVTNKSEVLNGDHVQEDQACGRVRVYEVEKKKSVVTLEPLKDVEVYKEKEARLMRLLSRF